MRTMAVQHEKLMKNILHQWGFEMVNVHLCMFDYRDIQNL